MCEMWECVCLYMKLIAELYDYIYVLVHVRTFGHACFRPTPHLFLLPPPPPQQEMVMSGIIPEFAEEIVEVAEGGEMVRKEAGREGGREGEGRGEERGREGGEEGVMKGQREAKEGPREESILGERDDEIRKEGREGEERGREGENEAVWEGVREKGGDERRGAKEKSWERGMR